MRPQFDERDAEILRAREATYNKIEGARVGDWLDMLDGTQRRFTHDWDEHGLQTTCGGTHPCAGDQSFYFGDGYASFSGSLDPCVPREKIEATGETRVAGVWFFHHDSAGAGRGVRAEIPFRVFREIERKTIAPTSDASRFGARK
jgi:hypothetical protein